MSADCYRFFRLFRAALGVGGDGTWHSLSLSYEANAQTGRNNRNIYPSVVWSTQEMRFDRHMLLMPSHVSCSTLSRYSQLAKIFGALRLDTLHSRRFKTFGSAFAAPRSLRYHVDDTLSTSAEKPPLLSTEISAFSRQEIVQRHRCTFDCLYRPNHIKIEPNADDSDREVSLLTSH